MTATSFDLTKTPAWFRLEGLAKDIRRLRIEDLLARDADRVEDYCLSSGRLSLDFSKNLVTDEVLEALTALVEDSPLAERREQMFRGEPINTTERRAVLHTALRASPADIRRDGLEVLGEKIVEQKSGIRAISEKIRRGEWRGSTGKAVTDIVNLGIGGSDLGPRLACEALKEFGHAEIRCHFVSNVDGEVIHSVLKMLNPETTLVIISSKTFTTQETLLNARTAADWFERRLDLRNPYDSPHFIGITASPENALDLGIPVENLLKFWDWVGGRYSLWSAIGLSIAISVGYDNFERMLGGARAMDEHFRSAPWRGNMPVILALLGIWYGNFLDAESHAVIPYCERLFQFPFYLQQLDMESNGKSVTHDGRMVDYSTGPIIWGLTGTNSQHSFFQLLHQGTHFIPVDFIGVLEDNLSSAEHHRILMANMLAQSSALMGGRRAPELPPYRNYPGNRPSNVLLLEALTPETFGALIALYEHKVFVQGCLWNINSFDQWGVELGKILTASLLGKSVDRDRLDPSTRALLARVETALGRSEN